MYNYLGSCLECDAMNGRILEEDSRYKTPRGNLNNSDKPSGIGCNTLMFFKLCTRKIHEHSSLKHLVQ